MRVIKIPKKLYKTSYNGQYYESRKLTGVENKSSLFKSAHVTELSWWSHKVNIFRIPNLKNLSHHLNQLIKIMRKNFQTVLYHSHFLTDIIVPF